MATNVIRETRTTADLNVVESKVVALPPRVRDLPPPAPPLTPQQWTGPELALALALADAVADVEAWMPLEGFLAGAYIHKEFHQIPEQALVHGGLRRVRKFRVLQLINKPFDPNQVGGIMVSIRPNNDLAVIEGNHRLAAVRHLKMTGFLFRCELYKGLTPAQEKFMWGGEEDRLRPSPMEKLVNLVGQGTPKAVAIERALAVHGVAMRDSVEANEREALWPYVEAGIQVVKAYDLYSSERRLEQAVGHAKRVWADARPIVKTAFDGHVLVALTYIRGKYESLVDPKFLDECLAKTYPQTLRAAGSELRSRIKPRVPNSLAQCIAMAIVGLYNTRRTSRRLPEWEWVK